MKRYTMKFRPVDSWTLPPGIRFEMVESGMGYERRTDLPLSQHRFGVFTTDRPLTPAEIESFEVVELPEVSA